MNSYKIVFKRQNIQLFLWMIVVLLLTRQVPLSSFSFIFNIAILILILYSIPKNNKVFFEYGLILIWLTFLIMYSLTSQNNTSYIIRFGLICLLILLSYYIKLPRKSINILFFFVAIQCLFITIIELYILFFHNEGSYLSIRFLFQDKNWGDIYTYSGYYYFIQLKGNALIPFTYMLTFIFQFKSNKSKWIFRTIFLIGILIAGNFAFLISLFCFHFFKYINLHGLPKTRAINRVFILCALLLIVSPIIISYIENVLDRKEEKSLNIRTDQFNVLINDVQENVMTILMGKGLGHTISEKTAYRDYTDNVYYELQIVYFFNQLGFLNFFIFLALNAYLALKYIIRKDLLWIYFCYVIYAITNPYILDTNHIVVIICLTSMNKFLQLKPKE
jgi:hypothetical protein